MHTYTCMSGQTRVCACVCMCMMFSSSERFVSQCVSATTLPEKWVFKTCTHLLLYKAHFSGNMGQSSKFTVSRYSPTGGLPSCCYGRSSYSYTQDSECRRGGKGSTSVQQLSKKCHRARCGAGTVNGQELLWGRGRKPSENLPLTGDAQLLLCP